MKAVRFSLPPDKKEEGFEVFGGMSHGLDEEENGYVETVSRNGSQQQLNKRDTGREVTQEKKTVNSFLCGLCCSKPPAVSVWNCDGEILPVTEILCRCFVYSHIELCYFLTVIICQDQIYLEKQLCCIPKEREKK